MEDTNRLLLTATVHAIEPLRFTPAGVPALNLQLEHASSVEEAGQTRQVQFVMKAVALGMLAERLAAQSIGSRCSFSGFLATPRLGKHVVFHIQDFSTHAQPFVPAN